MSAAHGGHPHLADPHWEASWLTTATRARMAFVALCVGLIVFLILALVESFMVQVGFSPFLVMMGSAAVAALLTFGFTLMLLLQVHDRREAIREQLRVIGETNHHIRNALELIQFSAHTTHDQQVIESISGAVDRIQWVLRELLGETGAYAPSDGERKTPPGLTQK
jgi:hypothetical protein